MISTQTKKKTRTKKLTVADLDAEIGAFVSLCFMMLSDMTRKQIADKSGLSLPTVNYLFAGRVSHRTHSGTLQRLGYAAGLKLELTESASRVRLVD